ncbi:unnamed protein product [Musa textilis]
MNLLGVATKTIRTNLFQLCNLMLVLLVPLKFELKQHKNAMFHMVVVLKKISTGVMLSDSEASEEFRVGIIRCFRAMLLNLQPCSVSSCSCKQRVIMPTSKSIDGAFVHHNTLSRNHVESLECLLAFLQSPNASAAEGHWLSLLLQVSCTCFVLFILFYCCIVTKCRIMFRASYTYILLLQLFKYLYIFLLNVVW